MNSPETQETGKDKLERVTLIKVEASIFSGEPINLNIEDIILLKQAYSEAGINFDLEQKERVRLMNSPKFRVKVNPEAQSIKERVLFYDYDKPRGERWVNLRELGGKEELLQFEEDKMGGILAMLGEIRTMELIDKCYKVSIAYPGKIGGYEGTQGRGLQQSAADILALSTLDSSGDDFEEKKKLLLDKINRRLWRSYRVTTGNEKERFAIDNRFSEAGYEEPKKTLAGFSPEAFPKIIRFLAKSEK